MKYITNQERNRIIDLLVNENSPDLDVNKVQKRFHSIPIHDGVGYPRSVATAATDLSMSWDDNFTNVSNNFRKSRSTIIDTQVIRNIMFSETHSDDDNESSDDEDNEILDDEDNEILDDDMSTDSDNQNMPDIDYEQELQSRHYHYARFAHQHGFTREVEGCEGSDDAINRANDYEEIDETISRIVIGCSEGGSNTPTRIPTYCGLRRNTLPITGSTMVDNSNTSILEDHTDLIPTAPSTRLSNCIPRASSTVMGDCSSKSFPRCNFTDYSDNLSTNNSLDRIHVLPPASLIDRLTQDHSICCTRDSMLVLMSSTLCRDEFSFEEENMGMPLTRNNKTLFRTSTIVNLNDHSPDLETRDTHIQQLTVKPKRLTFNILHVMKKATKNIGKKSKRKQNDTPQENAHKEELEVDLLNKRIVAKKLQRFRRSFHSEDTRQIETLANL